MVSQKTLFAPTLEEVFFFICFELCISLCLFRERDSHLFSCGFQFLWKKTGTKANTWSVLNLERDGNCNEYQRTHTDDLKTSWQSAVAQCFLPEVSVTQSFHLTSPSLSWVNTKRHVRKRFSRRLVVFVPHFYVMSVPAHRANASFNKGVSKGKREELRQDKESLFFYCLSTSFIHPSQQKREPRTCYLQYAATIKHPQKWHHEMHWSSKYPYHFQVILIRVFDPSPSPPTSTFHILSSVKVTRDGGLTFSALSSGSSGLGSSPGRRRGHCVVFLGKTLTSHSASLHPGV